jgi:4-hydroxy-2-oxoheptanedioate aldolase
VPEGTSAAPLAGTVLTLPGATAAELLAEPFDLVWVDLEHGALGRLDAQEVILGAQAAGTRALVRVPATAHQLTAAMLDAGADGVVFADVRDPAVAADAVANVRHPPDGTRGWGPRRLALRGRISQSERSQPSIWVQIESAEAVERIDEIAAVPGIEVLVVGTADLSFSIGTPLDTGAPEMLAAIDAVRRSCRERNLTFAVAGALEKAPASALDGASILVHATDARLCAAAVDDAAAWIHQLSVGSQEGK